MRCTFCGAKQPRKALYCSFCGTAVPQAAPGGSRRRFLVAGLAAAFVVGLGVIVGAVVVIGAAADRRHDANNRPELVAPLACQQSVKKRLKAPASADFPSPRTAEVSSSGNSTYTVRSYVDAENSFGANLRTNYTCTVSHKDGGWRLVSIDGL